MSSIAFNKALLINKIYPKYLNFKLYDKDAKENKITHDYKQQLIKREICKKVKLLDQFNNNFDEVLLQLMEITKLEEYTNIMNYLGNLRNTYKEVKYKGITKKLKNLYNGNFTLQEDKNFFLNLSNCHLSEKQKEVLNLGLNCHMKNDFDQFKEKTELEILYQSTLKLETEGKINIEDGFKECLINEGTKKRCYHNKSQLLSKEQLESIKNLRNNKDIIIRKADKSNIYVIMNYSDYKQKLDDIISDKSKFIQLKKDPTESLKKKLNNIIKCENAAPSNIKMKVLEGNYKPGYLYGNAKIHKDQANPKLRPIISQVNSPTYQVAKDLNNIIIKYMPKKYMINSTDEFLDILKSTENKENGILASLDVDSLFTNIPVEETIEIILQNVYNHNQLSKPAISKTILKKTFINLYNGITF